MLAVPLAASADSSQDAASVVAPVAAPVVNQQIPPPQAADNSSTTIHTIASKLTPIDMYRQADNVVKSIMLLLLGCSLLSWSVWIGKFLALSKLRRCLHASLTQLSQERTLQNAPSQCESITMQMLKIASQELVNVRTEGYLIADTLKERVGAKIWRIETRAAKQLGSGAGVLASVAAVAPFVGLLGTVWGIINSFTSIAQMQTTSLAVVAPGIAEALMATAMGLFAAIPAVILYNGLSRMISNCRMLIGDVSTSVMCQLSREIDYLQPESPMSMAA